MYWRAPASTGLIRQIFQPAPDQVIDAVWTKFKSDIKANGDMNLIVLHSSGMHLRIYNPNGSIVDVPLPINMNKIWALETGVLLQRGLE